MEFLKNILSNNNLTYWIGVYPRAVILITTIIIFIFASIVGMIPINSLKQDLDALYNSEKQLQQNLKTLERSEYSKIPYTPLNKLNNTKYNNNVLWSLIHDLGDKNKIIFKSINFIAEVDLLGLVYQDVQLHLEATYHDFGRFLQDVSNIPPYAFILWDKINMIKNNENNLNIEIMWRIYTKGNK